MSPRRRDEPAPNFTQPALPDLEAPPTQHPARSAPRLHLASVSALTPASLEERAADVMASLDAAGLFPDQHQVLALAAAGMIAPHAWTHPGHSDRRQAEAAETVATIRQDVTRRRAAASYARPTDLTTPTPRRNPR
ncbi:hypothetical protein D8M33_06665 [Micrococcus sp. HSID17245]|uniref:hypothetical protein n=1 Tax=Micrococcus sp. HSID17245 TaxID=2419508 RepID=UPI000F85ED3F|nr:hypothetical protein [Micrococcus sp. HSID17245]RUQ25216.1 hypothetical protein D8M33_06665 [Micrococcus sp. HSID17245]